MSNAEMDGVQVSQRVGCVYEADSERRVVRLIGFGVRVEDRPPVSVVGADPNVNPVRALALGMEYFQIPLRAVLLDDDDVLVWDCETWWGPEQRVRDDLEQAQAQGWTVEQVYLQQLRAESEPHREAGLAALRDMFEVDADAHPEWTVEQIVRHVYEKAATVGNFKLVIAQDDPRRAEVDAAMRALIESTEGEI